MLFINPWIINYLNNVWHKTKNLIPTLIISEKNKAAKKFVKENTYLKKFKVLTEEELNKLESSLNSLRGEILEKEMMLPNTKVADSDLNALYDALYIAKKEQDEVKIQSILDEINNFDVTDEEVVNEIIDREVNHFLDNIF